MTNTPADTYTDLKAKLREMFQMDQADLDFGIYRIMNAKRDEISDYLDNHLQPQVKEILQEVADGDGEKIAIRMGEIETAAKKFNADPNQDEEYKELLAQKSGLDQITALEQEIFSNLYSFFARYYEGGDFLSLRRYKAGVYAIPYEGEEVKLHWANADQYYIKTSEYFANYAFTLGKKRIAFRLVSASTEQNNNKAVQGKDRRFIPSAEQPQIIDDELVIGVEYRADGAGRKQAEIIDAAIETLKPMLDGGAFKGLFDPMPDKEISVLEHHLNVYTKRNSFDYFIHKDLGGFLRRELDFFIKNEVLILDNILVVGDDSKVNWDARRAKARALNEIAKNIITFLTSLEEFQKKLWLKKKFVVAADWCMTLDFVDEEFYDEIIANEKQHDAWVALFGIDGLSADLDGGVAYKKKLSVEFLRANQNLVLDTALFDADFKHRLMASIDDLDERTDGLLIHGDNFHALNLLQEGYRESVDCIYIDPPYNTDATPIVYKNNYKSSSWITLMSGRFDLSFPLFSKEKNHAMCIAIDDTEMARLSLLLENYSNFYNLHRIIVNHYPGSGTGRSNVTRTHEYALFLTPHDKDILKGVLKEDGIRERNFRRSGTGENNHRTGRPNSFYAVLVDAEKRKVIGAEKPPSLGEEYPKGETQEGYRRIYPTGEDGSERVWTLSYEGFLKALEQGLIKCTKNLVINRLYHDESSRSLLQSVWLDKKFNAVANGTNLLKDILGTSSAFSYPKSIYTVEFAIEAMTHSLENPVILDYFAGSGTTGHAVINLNREDGGKRKYILVEMGEYFETVTKPRIQKVIYAKDWKDGKPKRTGGWQGGSHCFKTIRLESYEDALNNLKFIPIEDQTSSPPPNPPVFEKPEHYEQYLLSYMLDMESRGSAMNLDIFENPFDYKMKITTHNQESVTPVDLVETFNYLIGLRVIARGVIQQFNAQMEPDEEGRVTSEGLKQNDTGEFSFQKLEGTNRDGKAVLVIWRTLTGNVERDSVALNKYLEKQDISSREHEFDVIYVNGDNTLPNIRKDNEYWKVQLIEDVFFDKMFAGGRG